MRFFVLAFALCLISFHAHADCANPFGIEGDLVYNADCKVPQYCNGDMWIALSEQSLCAPGGPAPTCPGSGLVAHWALGT